MVQGSGNIAEAFINHSAHGDGSTAKNFELINDNTKKRVVNENTIKGSVIKNGGNLDATVTRILTSYPDELSAYVAAHGEIADSNPVKLAVQAVLLRAHDVATQANAVDSSDEDALREIEKGEMAAQDINSPDNETILGTQCQAAMKIAMDHIADQHEAIGGDGSMSSALKDMRNLAVSKGNTTTLSNNADGDDPLAGIIDFGDYAPTPTTTILPGLATIPIDTGDVNPLTSMPTIKATPAPSVNTSGIIGSGINTGGVLGTLTSILSGIQSAAGAVTNTANAVGNAGGAVKNAIGNVGANSISTFISQNKGTIIFAILGVAFLIFIIIYASKKAK